VRIVAATNRDLKADAAAGRFRQDLFYRLNVFPIQVAPLRERAGDIRLLAEHFVAQGAQRLRVPQPRLTPEHLAQLQGYPWPGNVRELQNVIEHALIMARGGRLKFDLPVGEPMTLAPASPPIPAGRVLTESELQARDRQNVLAALQQADWKIHGPGGAAELLDVKPTTLISRIKKLGLKRPV
jgi:transcriptional regulator with GAF, ATPase, and Fis domain